MNKVVTDFYAKDGRVYYLTENPNYDNEVYVMFIKKEHKPISYSNMKSFNKLSLSNFLETSTPFNIGWVPVDCNLNKHYPELFL